MTSTTTDTRELLVLDRVDLAGLYKQALEIQSECRDFNVSNATYKNVRYDGDTCRLLYQPDGDTPSRSMAMTRHSLSQLCNKIGVPIRYIDKCIDSGRLDLAAENINSWIDDFGKNLFIREHGNTIRGVLSDRFSTLDTPHIMDAVNDVLDFDEYRIKGYLLTPERFHARIVQREMMNIDGEDLFAGIQIDSSDVGRSILVVKFMIWKQVCTNGLCVTKGGGVLFQQKHIGIDASEFRDGFRNSLSNIPLLVEYSKDLIEQARRSGDKYSINDLNENQVTDFIERIKMKTKLSDDGVEKVFQFMTEKYGFSQWGFINSLTEVAQDYTLERRLEIERIAGDFLVAV